MPKTIRELADELKVSKQTIQYHYQRLPAKNRQKNSQGTNMISPTAERIIRNKVAKPLVAKSHQKTNKEVAKSSKDNEWIITALKQEITEIKKERDKQLAIKDLQIDNLTKLLDQSQKLQLMIENQFNEFKAINSKQSSSNTVNTRSTPQTKKNHVWWHFW